MKKQLPRILFALACIGIQSIAYAQSSTFSIDMSVPLTNLLHSNSHILDNGNAITSSYNSGTNSSYITMINGNGAQLWSKEYVNTRIDDIHVMSNGNITFAGYFGISYSIWGMLDPNGNQLWAKKLYSYDFNYDLATADVLSNGKLLFGFSKFTRNVTVKCDENGNTEECDEGEDTLGNGKSPRFDNAPCNDGGYVGSCKSDDRIMIIRHDASGNVMWAKNYMKSTADYFHMKKIQQLPDGNFISIGLVSDSYSGPNNFGFILKLDPNGEIIWAKKYFLPGNVGYFSSTFRSIEINATEMYIGGYYSPDYITMNNFIMKLDLDGNVIWSKQILPTNSESLGSPIPTMGNVSFEQEIKNGYFIYNNYVNDGSSYRIELNKVDVNGVLGCYVSDLSTSAIPYSSFTGTIPAQYNQVSILDTDPSAITNEVLTVIPVNLDITTLCSSIAGLEDENSLNVMMFPNPAVEMVTIDHLNPDENYMLQIYDSKGSLAKTIQGITGTSTHSVSVLGLTAGNYVLSITGLSAMNTQQIHWIKQ